MDPTPQSLLFLYPMLLLHSEILLSFRREDMQSFELYSTTLACGFFIATTYTICKLVWPWHSRSWDLRFGKRKAEQLDSYVPLHKFRLLHKYLACKPSPK